MGYVVRWYSTRGRLHVKHYDDVWFALRTARSHSRYAVTRVADQVCLAVSK